MSLNTVAALPSVTEEDDGVVATAGDAGWTSSVSPVDPQIVVAALLFESPGYDAFQ